MYIEYSYYPASLPDEDLSISNVKNYIVSDIAQLISFQSDYDDLSPLCENVEYYGKNAGWTFNVILDDGNASISSVNTDKTFKKIISISSETDTTSNTSGFPTQTDPLTNTITYSGVSNAVLFLIFQVFDNNTQDGSTRLIKKSKTKFNYYASGGIIKISLSEHHLMICGMDYDKARYQQPLCVFDFKSYDIVSNNFPKFVFINGADKNFGYATAIPSTKTYDTVSTVEYYNVEIYDKTGIIKFYNPNSPDKLFKYANHIYVNYKLSSNYIIGGSISELCNVYVLPSNSIGVLFTEVIINNKKYVVWSMEPNDFSTKYNRFLILKE